MSGLAVAIPGEPGRTFLVLSELRPPDAIVSKLTSLIGLSHKTSAVCHSTMPRKAEQFMH
eukprot:jgi/Botrbrau1/5546/Bobra.0023s0029.1